jgi:hypothetical protein
MEKFEEVGATYQKIREIDEDALSDIISTLQPGKKSGVNCLFS